MSAEEYGIWVKSGTGSWGHWLPDEAKGPYEIWSGSKVNAEKVAADQALAHPELVYSVDSLDEGAGFGDWGGLRARSGR